MINGLNNIFSYRPLKYLLIIGMLIFIVAVLIPSESFFARSLVSFAAQGTILFLFLGLFFHIINQKWLMFAAFFTSAVVCLHLKTQISSSLIQSEVNPQAKAFSVAVLDLSNYDNDQKKLRSVIAELKQDVVALQNIPSSTYKLFNSDFNNDFSYRSFYYNENDKGIGFLSKINIDHIDTMTYRGLPNLKICFQLNNGKCINVYNTRPTLSENTNNVRVIKKYLQTIEQWVGAVNMPSLCLGNFNLVPWDSYFSSFKNKTKLLDSRTGFKPLQFYGLPLNYFYEPQIHILHSFQLNCTAFEVFSLQKAAGIKGVYGAYQVNVSNESVKLLSLN